MLEIDPISLNASVLLANEAFFSHSVSDAKKLHHGASWKRYIRGSYEPLSSTGLQKDVQRALLLAQTTDKILNSIRPLPQLVLEVRFGFRDGRIHPYKDIIAELAEYLPGVGINLRIVRGIQTRGLLQIRIGRRGQILRQFYEEPSVEILAQSLKYWDPRLWE